MIVQINVVAPQVRRNGEKSRMETVQVIDYLLLDVEGSEGIKDNVHSWKQATVWIVVESNERKTQKRQVQNTDAFHLGFAVS